MKVLHVITGLGAGGAETQLRALLTHSRHEAEVVCLYNAGTIAAQLRDAGIPVRDLGMRSNKQVGAVLRLAAIMRKGRFDVVHTHLYRACVYGRPAARLAGVPRIVATEHSLVDDQLEGRRATRGVRALYRATEALGHLTIAVSGAVRRNLLAWGVRPDRVVTVPNGLDMPGLRFDQEQRLRIRAALAVPDGADVIGAVGRLHPGKSFGELLREVAPGLNDGRQLLVVGEGDERRHLERLADALGVARYVHLVGERPVTPFLAAMDVLASPSRHETFGLAILEALANGLPVVYRRCPALEEAEVDIPGAHRLEPDGDLGAALDRVLAGPRGARSVPEGLDRLDVRHVAATIDELYRSGTARTP